MTKDYALAIDVDGVTYNSVAILEDQIARINYEATNAFAKQLLLEHSLREEVILDTYNETDSELCDRFMREEAERYDLATKRYHIVKDEVLEEVFPEYKNRINYHKMYQRENLFVEVINFIKFLQKAKIVRKIYFVTHFNALQEEIEKTFSLTLESPDVEIIFIPFHDTPYIYDEDRYLENDNRKRTNKPLKFKERTNEDLSKVIFIDDSTGICRDARAAGAIAFWRNPASPDPLEAFKEAYEFIMGETDEELYRRELVHEQEFEKKYQKLLRYYK